ncbi:hypothetical protein ACET3Z_005458 [Daucus carota]
MNIQDMGSWIPCNVIIAPNFDIIVSAYHRGRPEFAPFVPVQFTFPQFIPLHRYSRDCSCNTSATHDNGYKEDELVPPMQFSLVLLKISATSLPCLLALTLSLV